MYHNARRTLKILSTQDYITILITILLPALFSLALSYVELDLDLKIGITLGVFPVWSLFAFLAVAWMLTHDRSKAEQQITQQIGALPGRISKQEEELQNLRVDLRQEVDNLEESVRSAFGGLGVVLPPRKISVRAGAASFSFNVSAVSVTVVRGSKLAHLRLWLRRTMRRFWEVVYGRKEVS